MQTKRLFPFYLNPFKTGDYSLKVDTCATFNPFMPSGLSYLNFLDMSISSRRGCLGSFYYCLLPCFIENPLINANSVDPDQTPRSAASDLGLRCLPKSLLRDARHKWVNINLLCLNLFTPEFLTWTIPTLNLDTSIVANRGFSQKTKTEWRTV